MPTSPTKCLGSGGVWVWYRFLLMHSLDTAGDGQATGSFYPCGRPRLYSRLLYSSAGCCRNKSSHGCSVCFSNKQKILNLNDTVSSFLSLPLPDKHNQCLMFLHFSRFYRMTEEPDTRERSKFQCKKLLQIMTVRAFTYVMECWQHIIMDRVLFTAGNYSLQSTFWCSS